MYTGESNAERDREKERGSRFSHRRYRRERVVNDKELRYSLDGELLRLSTKSVVQITRGDGQKRRLKCKRRRIELTDTFCHWNQQSSAAICEVRALYKFFSAELIELRSFESHRVNSSLLIVV